MPQMTRGFTLSELLVSLAVLGLISALTLPKIFTNVENLKKKAVFKETFMVLQQMYTTNHLKGGMFIRKAQLDTLNATKTCAGLGSFGLDPAGNSCRTTNTFENGALDNQGFILPSGAHVWALDPNNRAHDAFIIDWNGHAGKNTIGDDIMMLNACADPDRIHTNHGNYCKDVMANPIAGSVEPGDSPSTTLFNKVILNQT